MRTRVATRITFRERATRELVVQKATREIDGDVTDDAGEKASALHGDESECDSIDGEAERGGPPLLTVRDAEQDRLGYDADRNRPRKYGDLNAQIAAIDHLFAETYARREQIGRASCRERV